MVLNICAALCGHYITVLVNIKIIESIPIMCFIIDILQKYFVIVLVFLVAAEAVNMFLKVVLVFKTIEKFALKASLVAWSKSWALLLPCYHALLPPLVPMAPRLHNHHYML